MLKTDFAKYYSEGSHSVFLKEEKGIIKHLTHLEELILKNQKKGFDTAVSFIKELQKVFQGDVNTKIFTTVKYDGSPSIIAGYNPENNKFFVATKGLAAKRPKINYTDEDISINHGHAPGLVKKLELALEHLPKVIKSGLYQGDFMYDRDDLRQIDYNGERLITFKPNTITYTVPADSELGKKIIRSKIGIIFHTKLTGPLENFEKSPDVSVTEFNETKDVFVDDAKFKDVSGTATLTEDEDKLIDKFLKQAENAANQIEWDEIPAGIYDSINTFINTLIKNDRFVLDPVNEFAEFVKWHDSRMIKSIEKLKTESGKAKAVTAKDELIKKINEHKNCFTNIFYVTLLLEKIKKIFINKYNSAIKTKQFIAQPDGTLKVTAPEGYVAVDHSGNMVKLVDRLEFSRANFAISKEEKFK